MQKKLIFFLLFFLINSFSGICNEQKMLLEKADTLFSQSKWAEAMPYYDALYSKYGLYSDQMLLKMAFIAEKKEVNIPQAMLYLNSYNRRYYNPNTIDKMQEIALQQKLKGYTFSDREYVLAFTRRYRQEMLLVGALPIMALLFMVWQNKRRGKKTSYYAGSLVFLGLVYGVLYNFPLDSRKGILKDAHVYLMASPSAGAEVIQMLDKGHRVHILAKEDIWYKILWEGKEGFVRQHHIALVR